jgi:hypothetical protein
MTIAPDDLPKEIIDEALTFHRFLQEQFRETGRRWWIPPHDMRAREIVVALADCGLVRVMFDAGHYYALPPRRRAGR